MKPIEEILLLKRKELSSTQRIRKQRYLKWKENPNCHWCGKETIYVDFLHKLENSEEFRKIRNNIATIDHLHSRYNLEDRRSGKNKHLLSCYECNQKWGRSEDILNLKLKQERSRKSNFDYFKSLESIR